MSLSVTSRPMARTRRAPRGVGYTPRNTQNSRNHRAGSATCNFQVMLIGRSPSAVTSVTGPQARYGAPFQAGTLTLPDRRCELLFVTLDKREGYHDRIAYRDYAISTERFHWQTQHTAGPDTPAGRRYLESATNGWQFQLFVRTAKGAPYRACGPVTLIEAEGDRPMSITWGLQVALPARWFREFCVLRGV